MLRISLLQSFDFESQLSIVVVELDSAEDKQDVWDLCLDDFIRHYSVQFSFDVIHHSFIVRIIKPDQSFHQRPMELLNIFKHMQTKFVTFSFYFFHKITLVITLWLDKVLVAPGKGLVEFFNNARDGVVGFY